MASHRAQHNFESTKREITAIVQKMHDPRLKSGFINILKISASEDGSVYHVYISSLEGIKTSEKAAQVLNSASGFIKNELGKRLRLRRIPNIKSIATDAIEYGINMSKKIDELNNKFITSNSTNNSDD